MSSSDWLSIARWNADSLNEQAVSLVKKKRELSPFWYADDTLASSPHRPQRRVRSRSSHRDLQLPPSIWRSAMTHPFDLCFQEEVLGMSSAVSENLDGIFDCASMFASPLNPASLSLHLVVMSDCLFSIHVALNSLALIQALIPLLPGSKFILSADLISDQNLRLHLTLHAPLLRWSSSLYNQICPFCWSL